MQVTNSDVILAAIGTVLLVLIGATAIALIIIATKIKNSTEAIHVAVNSERTKMTDEIRKLRKDILDLTASKAVTQERLNKSEESH
jgi:hypothetical protein